MGFVRRHAFVDSGPCRILQGFVGDLGFKCRCLALSMLVLGSFLPQFMCLGPRAEGFREVWCAMIAVFCAEG